jgi:hypothetical protein
MMLSPIYSSLYGSNIQSSGVQIPSFSGDLVAVSLPANFAIPNPGIASPAGVSATISENPPAQLPFPPANLMEPFPPNLECSGIPDHLSEQRLCITTEPGALQSELSLRVLDRLRGPSPTAISGESQITRTESLRASVLPPSTNYGVIVRDSTTNPTTSAQMDTTSSEQIATTIDSPSQSLVNAAFAIWLDSFLAANTAESSQVGSTADRPVVIWLEESLQLDEFLGLLAAHVISVLQVLSNGPMKSWKNFMNHPAATQQFDVNDELCKLVSNHREWIKKFLPGVLAVMLDLPTDN